MQMQRGEVGHALPAAQQRRFQSLAEELQTCQGGGAGRHQVMEAVHGGGQLSVQYAAPEGGGVSRQQPAAQLLDQPGLDQLQPRRGGAAGSLQLGLSRRLLLR